jgi:hypothetical protein
MATVNVRNASAAAQVQPTVGSTPRNAVSPNPVARLLAGAAELGQSVVEASRRREANLSEAAAATRILDEVLGQEAASFGSDPVADQVTQVASRIVEETGGELTEGQRNALSAAAQLSQRLNSAQATADPSAVRRLNNIRTRELRNLIAQHPEMAREFRHILYGDNNFVTSLLEGENQEAAMAAKARAEQIGRVRNMLLDNGYLDVVNMNDDQVVAYAEQTGFMRDLRQFNAAKMQADMLKAQAEAGEVVDKQLVNNTLEQLRPGAVRSMMTVMEEIVNNPNLDETAKVMAINDAAAQRRVWLASQFPTLGSEELNSRFGDVLNTLPELYREIAQGRVTRAQSQLALARAVQEFQLRERFPQMDMMGFVADTYSKLSNVLGETWALGSLKSIEASMRPFLENLAAELNGASPPQLTPTTRADADIANDATAQADFVLGMARQIQNADPEQRRAVAQQVVQGLTHPDNLRSEAGLDKWIERMASPEFANIARTKEFQDAFQGSQAHRAFESYMGNLDIAIGRALNGLEGKVQMELDKDGYVTFIPDPSLPPRDRDRVLRVANRMRNVLKAQVNVFGVTPEEAVRMFVEEYLEQ